MAQGTGLALHGMNVVLPIVEGVITLEAASMPCNHLAIGYQHQLGGVCPQADHLMGRFGRYAVTITLVVDQGRGRDPDRMFDVGIEGLGVGHQVRLFGLEDFRQTQCRPFRMRHLFPCRSAFLR